MELLKTSFSTRAMGMAENKKLFTLLDLCVSSLRRGHANLLCIVPILTDDPRRESIEKGRFGRARFNAKALLFVGMAEDASAQFAMLRKPGRVLEHSCTSRRATTTPTPRKMAMPTGVQPPCHCR